MAQYKKVEQLGNESIITVGFEDLAIYREAFGRKWEQTSILSEIHTACDWLNSVGILAVIDALNRFAPGCTSTVFTVE